MSSEQRAALLECRDPDGRSAFILCCMCDHLPAASWLVEKGADIHAVDRWQQDALVKTMMSNSLECLQLLLSAGGATTDPRDSDGKPALLWACEFDHIDVVRLLHRFVPSIRFGVRNERGITPLLAACEQGSLACATFLIDEVGVDVEETDKDGKTALIHSAMHGNLSCVQLLLARGAAVEHADDDGDTALIWAAWQGQRECVEYLLVHQGAQINHQDRSGLTALMQAVRWSHAACVRTLLDHGADATLTSANGSTAWSLAVTNETPDEAIIAWLTEAAAQQEKKRSLSGSSASDPIVQQSSAQQCFVDGLHSIFLFLPLHECFKVLPLVCRHWRHAWGSSLHALHNVRLPLHFFPWNEKQMFLVVTSPAATLLRRITALQSEREAHMGSASASIRAPATSELDVFQHSVSAPWSVSTDRMALLSARCPRLEHLAVHLQMPLTEMIHSDDEASDDEDEEALAGDLAALALQPVDLYEPDDASTFRFPFQLQSLHLSLNVPRGGGRRPTQQQRHDHFNDGDESEDGIDEEDDEEDIKPNPNLSRVFAQISRLPWLHTLCLFPTVLDGGSLTCVSLLASLPSLRVLVLQPLSEFEHIALNASTLHSLSQLPSLQRLSLNRGDVEAGLIEVLLQGGKHQLRELQTFNHQGVVMEAARLAPALARLPALTELHPRYWAHSRDFATLALFPRLRSLHLRLRAEVSSQAVPAADLAPLALLPDLTHLSFGQMGVASMAGTAALRVGLAAMPLLRSLHLSHVCLPVEILQIFAECTPGLEQLHLHHCPLIHAPDAAAVGAPMPAADIRSLPALTQLRSFHCAFALMPANGEVIDLLRFPSKLVPSLRTLHWQPCVDPAMSYNHPEREASSTEGARHEVW